MEKMLSVSLHPHHFPLARCPFSSVSEDICMVHVSLKHKCSFDVLSTAQHRSASTNTDGGWALQAAGRAAPAHQLPLLTGRAATDSHLKECSTVGSGGISLGKSSCLSLPKVLPVELLLRPGPDTVVSSLILQGGRRELKCCTTARHHRHGKKASFWPSFAALQAEVRAAGAAPGP